MDGNSLTAGATPALAQKRLYFHNQDPTQQQNYNMPCIKYQTVMPTTAIQLEDTITSHINDIAATSAPALGKPPTADGAIYNVMNDNVSNSFDAANIVDDENDDEELDLTSLAWLTELRNQTIAWPNANALDDDQLQQRSGTPPPSLTVATPCRAQRDSDNAIGCQNPTSCDERCSNHYLPDTSRKAAVPLGPPNSRRHCEFHNNKSGDAAHTNLSKHAKRLLTPMTPKSKAVEHQQHQPTAEAKRPSPTERYEMFLSKIKRNLTEYGQSASTYQTDTMEKPPFNYSHIIGMAMLENGRVTLQQICTWIETKFAFFRVRKKWNNSIRHNLSLHYCFRKIDRKKYEKGKGGYWELGVDLRKCDRKRIRNRKATIAPSTRAQRHFYNNNKANKKCSSREQLSENCSSVNRLLQQKNLDSMLMNELNDVPDGSDAGGSIYQVVHDEQQEELTSDALQLCNAFSPEQNPSQPEARSQQYQLGTIIISTTAADIFATATCLLRDHNEDDNNYNHNGSSNYSVSLQHQLMQVDDEIPEVCENVTISPFLQRTSPLTTLTSADVIESGTMPAKTNQLHSANPNIIVERLVPAASSTTISARAIAGTIPITATDFANHIAMDNFRPYIDGIEEAFQYLRSMDTNREDILDNLLDISVSDY